YKRVPNRPAPGGGARAGETKEERIYCSVVKHWDVATGQETKGQRLEGGGANLALAADGSRLLTVAGWPADTAKAADLATGKAKELRGHTGPVHRAAFSSDGKSAVTAGGGPTLKLWDLASARERWSAPLDHGLDVLAFSPDGKTVGVREALGFHIR